MRLVIVESPTKVASIQKYLDQLGSGWTVKATAGHFRDLPTKEMGVEPPNFVPQYVIDPQKSKLVAQLRALAKEADDVYLATDPDREGEAIAYHLKEALSLRAPKRCTFKEITPAAVAKAVQAPRAIDMQLVAAQEARRVLDRIVGYTVSPHLSRQAGIALSAGRVQSPAVKIVVLREREIGSFVPKDFYSVRVTSPEGLVANLVVKDWAADGKRIYDLATASAIVEETSCVEVVSVETADKEVRPRPPLITSTMLQIANKKFGISPDDAMKAAQRLFELGAITYHRTDNPNLSGDGFAMAADYLSSVELPVQQVQLAYTAKKDAQEAHEAIRPTNFLLERFEGATEAENRLYALIREYALASVMPPAIDTHTTVVLQGGSAVEGKLPIFVAKGVVPKFPGWRVISQGEADSDSGQEDSAIPFLPEVGKSYPVRSELVAKRTEPPARFTEATLIKALETLGIGRPSTFASILQNIIKTRGYLQVGGGKGKGKKADSYLRPTPAGVAIVEALEPMRFMQLDYTRLLEETLDDIARGKTRYLDVVRTVYHDVTTELPGVKIPLLIETAPCPLCCAPLQRRKSKEKGGGHYWAHVEDAPECRKFLPDANGAPAIPATAVTAPCPLCGAALRRLKSRDREAWFWAHVEDGHACEKFIPDRDGAPVPRNRG